jgi:hypothetical protein
MFTASKFYLLRPVINATTKSIIKTKINIAMPPHKGANTQTHDQLIKPVNFKAMNKMPSKLKKLMPPLLLELLSFFATLPPPLF